MRLGLRAARSCRGPLLRRWSSSATPALAGQSGTELFDVVAAPPAGADFVEGASLTGATITREAAHAGGAWHRSVQVWLADPSASAVLLQLRSAHKDTHPNLWDVSVAGHVDAGERPAATAARECAEELGLAGLRLRHLGTAVSTTRGRVPGAAAPWLCNELQEVYVGHIDQARELTLEAAEVAAVCWLPADALGAALLRGDPAFVPRTAAYWARVQPQLFVPP